MVTLHAQHSSPSSTDGAGELILSPSAPLFTARKFIEERYNVSNLRTLHHHDDVFYAWDGRCYPRVDDATIRAEVYGFLEVAIRWNVKAEKTVPFDPTTRKVNDMTDALRAVANVPNTITPPAWLVNEYVPDMTHPPSEILACSNGLLHLPTLELQPHTPLFFSHNALEFAFNPAAGAGPPNWLKFLSELWQDDEEAIETLQEIFGYFLTAKTEQQKIVIIIGPKRSGKGTIGHVLTGLLGPANVVAPTLANLAQNFGLAPLIRKPLAIIADARIGARTDQAVVTERLLSISGEDFITIDRKFLPAWTGKLPTRFLILTNEVPRLADASGALASRFIVLNLTKSFYGQEDLDLKNRLLGELPEILNWAIEGWQRLRDRRHFLQPSSSADIIEALEDLGSPVGAFVREKCVIESGKEVAFSTLFEQWKTWCEDSGRKHSGTIQSFGRDLHAAVPSIKKTQRRAEGGSRSRYYQGIGLA